MDDRNHAGPRGSTVQGPTQPSPPQSRRPNISNTTLPPPGHPRNTASLTPQRNQNGTKRRKKLNGTQRQPFRLEKRSAEEAAGGRGNNAVQPASAPAQEQGNGPAHGTSNRAPGSNGATLRGSNAPGRCSRGGPVQGSGSLLFPRPPARRTGVVAPDGRREAGALLRGHPDRGQTPNGDTPAARLRPPTSPGCPPRRLRVPATPPSARPRPGHASPWHARPHVCPLLARPRPPTPGRTRATWSAARPHPGVCRLGRVGRGVDVLVASSVVRGGN
ncbi:hypothetical protein HNR67_003735 [Crossiella cryophila]|uniref:Uncharacterized protein n=1 Tax=Crossiella cryophila TaxID=43355 RepID=A0A7W7FTV6_9PSEU|nr:hypothetical protein [Crossiella cryophila]